MVKVPSTLYRLACASARRWTASQLYDSEVPEIKALVFSYNNECCCLPFDDVVSIFEDCGYGDDKATKWINRWNDRSLIKWTFVDAKNRFACFPEEKLTLTDLERVAQIIDDKKKKEQKILDEIRAGGVPA